MKQTLIQNAPLFSSLTPDDQRIVGKAMKELTFGKGETLFAQGQPNQRMFLLQSGWVKQTTLLDGGRPLVNNLGSGSLVGDMDVLLEQPASGTAITTSEVCAWVLTQSDLNDLLDDRPHIGLKISAALGSRISHIDRYLVQTRLRGIPLFSDLADEQLAAIAEKLEPLEIRRGGLIYRSGAPGDALFIIEEGEVNLSSTHEESGEPFRQLSAGEAMGEMAVLAGKPYDDLARASTEVLLWVFHRSEFLAVTTKFPQIRVAMSGRLSQPLSSDDRVLAQRQLAKIRLFADLPYDAARSVAGVLVLRHYPAGEVVFKAGDPGDSLVVVDSGGLTMTTEGARPWRLISGDSYGESSLLTGRSRTVTAIAEVDSNLWIMYKSDFDSLVARFPAVGAALSKAISSYLQSSNNLFLDQHLRGITLFAGLGEAALREIANSLVSQRAQRGDVIFSEGQRGDAVYFIETGEVQIGTRVGDSYRLAFERMQAGDFFGELALLADTPRKSTARASAVDTQLWVLNKHDFDRIAVEYPQIALSLSKVLGERLARTGARPTAPKHLQVRPPTSGATTGGAARAPTVKPSPVPTIKRPTAAAPRSTPGLRAVPLTVKPPVSAQPKSGVLQDRPVPKRPSQPLFTPRTRANVAPQARAVAPRPAPRTAMTVRQANLDPATLVVVDGVRWVMARSLGFKFRMAALSMMFVWLCGITAPVAALSALAMKPVGTQIALAGVAVNIGSGGFGPVPVRAELMPTFTPTAQPTAKPVKSSPVETNPTQTTVAVALAPTQAPVRPTPRQVRPTVVPTPADPIAASAPAPAAAALVDFKIEKVHHLTPCENEGNHNMFVLVLDPQGNGIPNIDVEFLWDGGSIVDRSGRKVENIPALGVNSKTTRGFVDWPNRKGHYKVRVVSGTSEQTDWLSVDLPDERCDATDNPQGNSLFHHSYLIVFRRTH
jgi:CRP-like cAMP-binding protein